MNTTNDEQERLNSIANKITADYKEHYAFPPQGESHMTSKKIFVARADIEEKEEELNVARVALFESWAVQILGDSPTTWRGSKTYELAWQAWQASAESMLSVLESLFKARTGLAPKVVSSQSMTTEAMQETCCWKCSKFYPMADRQCPHCCHECEHGSAAAQ
jgi:hypothetical protein